LQASFSASSASTSKASDALALVRAHALVFAYLAALAPAVLMALTQPVWSLVDEAQHADFVIQLSHGVYPVADRTLITQETLQISKSTGVYRAFYPPGSYPTPSLTDAGAPPDGISERANAAWVQRHLWQLSLESVQTPGYYLAMVPAWWLADRLAGPLAGVYTLRLINALIVATLAPMTVIVARALFPSRPAVAVLAAVLAILLPGFDLNGTRISNDTLAAALGGLIVVLAVRWSASRWSWRRTALAGMVLGAGLLVKLTLLGLAPALAVSALWPDAPTSWRGRIGRAAVAGVIAVACLTPWFLVNLHDYGTAFRGARVARLSDAVPGQLNGPFVVLDVAVFVLTYWTGEPWGALPLAAILALLGGLIAIAAAVGIVKTVRTPAATASRTAFWTVVAAAAGMVGLALVLPASGSFEFVAAGRYAYPALPAIAVLGASGICAVLTKQPAQRVAGATYAALAVMMLSLASLGLPAPQQAGAGAPPADASFVSTNASGQMQSVNITVDRVALDRAGRATWFEATVSNAGPEKAEWTVPPVVTAGRAGAIGEYLKSTHFPGDIDAGQTVTGWLYVPLDPAAIQGARSIHLRFTDVALGDYRTFGDIDLDLRL
jgi:hypothetical protein